MSDLYGDDILLWSEQQAELLRRRATGELVNDAELDWPNIAEDREALRRLPEVVNGVAPLPVPQVCPVTLEELLSEPGDD